MTKNKITYIIIGCIGFSVVMGCSGTPKKLSTSGPVKENLISNIRQMTFDGRRAGEGYFSSDGNLMIFQSEREPNNPFYQMYLRNLKTADLRRISTGIGKTTCGWIHPSAEKVLFASTHQDPKAVTKMQEEIEIRKKGTLRPYSWDFDENYEIYEFNLKTGSYKNLTQTRGYDAEASWSPDGQWIVFSSDRSAYLENLSPEEKLAASQNPSALVELYIMKADGSMVRRLTHDVGYDGGAFFSPDGKKIVWRKFSPDGRTAEIYTMNVDGSGIQQITHLNTLSWAPYYHPSGDYIIFGSALRGHNNFELFIVRSDGQGEVVQVTYFPKFDSLPVFTPDGHGISWVSQRSWDGSSQIFLAQWNDGEARKILGLPPAKAAPPPASLNHSNLGSEVEIKKHVEFLSAPTLEGRLTGSPGEQLATQYVADQFKALGLKPAGDGKTYFNSFSFPTGVQLGSQNFLKGPSDFILDKNWRPLVFSASGSFEIKEIVFAGYGIVAPGNEEFQPMDSYQGVDVKDKWALVFRYLPEKLTEKEKLYLTAFSDLPNKIRQAKERGAKGIIFINGPNSGIGDQLIPFSKLGSDQGIFAINVVDAVVQSWLQTKGLDLKALQDAYDERKENKVAQVIHLNLSGQVDLQRQMGQGRNVLGRLMVGSRPTASYILVGAHIDHLGHGETSTSRADKNYQGQSHLGADDNASGVAAMLEMARLFTTNAQLRTMAKRDIVFAAWSGEELGLLGSSHFVKSFNIENLQSRIEAYFNLDMVGRLNDNLYLQGVGSSNGWKALIEAAATSSTLPLYLQEDPYLPTDVLRFYLVKVPVLNAFTGSHKDYHTPLDTANKINYHGVALITQLFSGIVARTAGLDHPLVYQQVRGGSGITSRAGFRISLGTMPDYTQPSSLKGVKLSGVIASSPADRAGIKANDVVLELNGRKVNNINEYADMLRILKPGIEIDIKIQRGEEILSLKVVPEVHK